ncbi:MAG: hypothetical protein NTX25_06140 [Proteobacteria bacterium]|nr:hypothetical protein [Pseudomonadota bacterium]
MRVLLVSLLLASCFSRANAAEQEAIFVSPHNQGRGNTFVAAFDSNETTRFNPAALAETQSSFQLRYLQLDGVLGQNSFDTLSELSKLATVSDGLGFLRSFDKKFGKRQYLRGQLSALAVRIKNFEFQTFASNGSWLELRQPTTPQAEFNSDSFAGVQLSYAQPLGAQMMVGASLRPLYRLSIHGHISFTDIIEFTPPSETKFDDFAPLQSGLGYGADLGLIWRPSPALRLGLSIQNVGDTAFKNSDPNKRPSNLKAVPSLGLLYRSKLGNWDLDFSTDVQELSNRQGLNLSRLVHMGVELAKSFYSKDHDIGVLAGINEGYFSAGAFLDVWLFRLDISNYAVELGETPGQRMDRRWAITLQSTTSF